MSILEELVENSEEKNRFNKKWMRICTFLCTCAACILTCWCFYKYMKDDDVSLVNYKRYHSDKDSVYPSLTLCFNNPFLNDKLEDVGDGVNTTTYSKFLEGLHWDNRLVHINYDSVTLDIDEYLDGVRIVLANGTVYENSNHPTEKMYYISMRSSSVKCFSFDTPFLTNVGVEYLVVAMKNSIFPHGYRPMHHDFDASTGKGGGFEVRFNIPGQVFRSDFTAKWIWESLGHNASRKWVGMTFKLKNVEVLKLRSKSSIPCNSEWQQDDQKIKEAIMSSTRCKPPHWNITTDRNICSWVIAAQLILLFLLFQPYNYIGNCS